MIHAKPHTFLGKKNNSMTDAMGYYGHTKYLMQVFVDGLPNATTHSPGPVFSSMGSELVPFIVRPFYNLMKTLHFPAATVAARPILDVARAPAGKFLHLRVFKEPLLPSPITPTEYDFTSFTSPRPPSRKSDGKHLTYVLFFEIN